MTKLEAPTTTSDNLTADIVEKMLNPVFIITSEPKLKVFKKDNPETSYTKYCFEVSQKDIKDGKTYLFIANNTSYAKLYKMFGDESTNWIGKTFELEVLPQMVNGVRKKVLYVK